jgi:hypothetical protein
MDQHGSQKDQQDATQTMEDRGHRRDGQPDLKQIQKARPHAASLGCRYLHSAQV